MRDHYKDGVLRCFFTSGLLTRLRSVTNLNYIYAMPVIHIYAMPVSVLFHALLCARPSIVTPDCTNPPIERGGELTILCNRSLSTAR